MVATEDSANAHLLRGHVGQWRSDDNGNVEIVVDFKASHVALDNSSARRPRILHHIGQKVAQRVRSIGTKTKERHKMNVEGDKENVSAFALATKTNRSSYDEGSILEQREGPPLNDDELCETFSTVSSDISSSPNQQRRSRQVTQWKSCMQQSVRKLLRKEMEDEMKGNPPKYQEFGLHLFPQDTVFDLSKDRKRSAFSLFVPTLNSPTHSHDAESDAGQYDDSNDFHLKSRDEITIEDAMCQYADDGKELKFPLLSPRRSNLFVSFDDEMAQIIFHSASSETDEYQAVEVHSVESDIEVISHDDGTCLVDSPTTSTNVGAALSLPSLVDQPSLGTIRGTPHPRKFKSARLDLSPSWQRTGIGLEIENSSDDPFLNAAVTNPASSAYIDVRRVEPLGLGQPDAKESRLAMTDEILKARGLYSPALPEIP